jgi:hypothetical protein
MYFAFQEDHGIHSYIWTVWFILFGFEMWMVMGVSYITPDIGFEDTHLVVRMGLLTLIIIGEGVIAVTRIANKTVRPGGWTKWSFVHILGVTTSVVRDIGDQILLSSTDLSLFLVLPVASLFRCLPKTPPWQSLSTSVGSAAFSVSRGPHPTP